MELLQGSVEQERKLNMEVSCAHYAGGPSAVCSTVARYGSSVCGGLVWRSGAGCICICIKIWHSDRRVYATSSTCLVLSPGVRRCARTNHPSLQTFNSELKDVQVRPSRPPPASAPRTPLLPSAVSCAAGWLAVCYMQSCSRVQRVS